VASEEDLDRHAAARQGAPDRPPHVHASAAGAALAARDPAA
jgi:hypothetical protein